jgi:hypothetical protein
MENGSRIQVASMNRPEKVKVESESGNKSMKEPSKQIKSTASVNKSLNNSDKKSSAVKKSEAELKEELAKII